MKTHTFQTGLLTVLTAAGVLLTAQPGSAALKNRYSFNEAAGSTTVIDSVSGSNGVARVLSTTTGTLPAFDGSQATLDGAGGYIDLPNRLISGLTNTTLELWVTWNSGGTWTRILDFGTNSLGEDVNGTLSGGTGGSYVFLAATAGSTPRFAITTNAPPGNGGENPVLNSSIPLPQGVESYIVVTYGPSGSRMFIDGVQVATGTYGGRPLSAIQDANNYLGRSNWPDPFFGGSFNEFRIHDNLLSQLQILASKAGGPGATNYTPESPTSISLVVITNMTAGTAQSPSVDSVFPTYGAITLGAADVTITSSATNIVRVEAGNVLIGLGTGTATLTASLGGRTSVATINVNPPNVFTALKHRYAFNEPAGSGTVTDSVGGAAFSGTVNPPTTNVPPVVVSNGVANFPGGGYDTAGYISLPPNMISSEFTNVTVEFWFTWNGANNAAAANQWQRVFDFGSSAKGSDPHVNAGGQSYIMFTPRRNGGGGRNEFRATGDGTTYISTFNDQPASPGFPVGREVHVVSTFAPGIGYSALYIDGFLLNINSTPLVGNPPAAIQFSQLSDPNIWLGMSQWPDPALNGRLNEFRIHEGVLDELKIALSRKAGPDSLPIANPGTLQNISIQAASLYQNNPAATQAVLSGNYQNVTGVEITGFDGVQFLSSDPNLFTVTTSGAMTPVANQAGTANLIVNYKTMSATTAVTVLAPLALNSPPMTTNAGGLSFTMPLFADFAGGLTNVNVSSFTGVARSSSATNLAAINNAGTVTFLGNPGTAAITSSYGGLTNSSSVTLIGFARGALAHRWSFGEAKESTTVKDSVGTSDGEVRNLQSGQANGNFTGTGQFMMGPGAFLDPPATNAYINLPNGLISSLSSVTIEGWFTWFGGADNQRIFDFGMSSAIPDATAPNGYAEDAVLNPGRSYFFLSPQAGRPRFAMKQGTGAETPSLQSPTTITITASNQSHFALVYDQPRGVVRLYVNGIRANIAAATLPLSVVDDRNNWIGRSQWQDPYFNGSIDEFRIYNGSALDSDIAADFAAGPNALAVDRPTLSFSKSGNQLTLSWPTSAGAFTLKSSPVLGSAAVWTSAGAPNVVGANNQITVPTTNNGAFYRLEQ